MSLFWKKNKIEFKKFKTNIEASAFVADQLLLEIKKNKKFNLGLITGSTPILLYKALISDFNEANTSWSNVHTYNLDEYLGLPEGHIQSNKEFMKNELFTDVKMNLKNAHFPLKNNNYDALIGENGEIDILILELGTNGHIGFNEPGTKLDTITRVVNLKSEVIEINATNFFDGDINKVPKRVMSMGLNSILKAKKIYLLAFGSTKKNAIEKLYNAKKFDINFPASALLKHKDVVVVFDDKVKFDI